MSRKVWKRTSGLVAISDGIKKELVRQGVSSDKILVARDAVDIVQFSIQSSKKEARERLGLPVDKKIVLYTGHLYDWKGASLLAEMAPRIDADIYLVGGTKEDVAGYKAKYQSPNLKIIGWQEPRSIPLWLRAADVLVLPNSAKTKIGSEYTSPLKLFEYMASGTPMIVSNVSAVKEVLSDKEAVFFKADNSEDLTVKIKMVLENSRGAVARAQLAENKVGDYSWNKRAEAILDFIKKSKKIFL